MDLSVNVALNTHSARHDPASLHNSLFIHDQKHFRVLPDYGECDPSIRFDSDLLFNALPDRSVTCKWVVGPKSR